MNRDGRAQTLRLGVYRREQGDKEVELYEISPDAQNDKNLQQLRELKQ